MAGLFWMWHLFPNKFDQDLYFNVLVQTRFPWECGLLCSCHYRVGCASHSACRAEGVSLRYVEWRKEGMTGTCSENSQLKGEKDKAYA